MKKVIVIGLFGAICLICAKFISAQTQATEKTSPNPQVMRAADEADSLSRIISKQLSITVSERDGDFTRVRKLSETNLAIFKELASSLKTDAAYYDLL